MIPAPNRLLTTREAWEYVRGKLGVLVPTWETWLTYSRPSWQERNPGFVAARQWPPTIRLPHRRQGFRRVADLERFIEAERKARGFA